MHSVTNLAFCRENECVGHRQSPTSSDPGMEYLPSGHTVVAFTAPPGQKWFSLQTCRKNRLGQAYLNRFPVFGTPLSLPLCG